MHCGEFGKEEKALNFLDIVAKKMAIRTEIYDFQASGLTCLKIALMLLGTMVPGEELWEEKNENELLEEV